MAAITVRVTRTWDVPVDADYGDDDAALIEKAKGVLDDGDPSNDPIVEAELCTVIDARYDHDATVEDDSE